MVTVTVGPSFAVVWFPNDEVGLAIAIDLLSHNVGLILGSILPPAFLKNPPVSYNSTSTASEATLECQETWKTNAAFTLSGFDDQERNLTFVKTAFQV